MRLFGPIFGPTGGGGGGGGLVFPVLAIATTAEAIRDRAIAVVTALVPRKLSKDRLRKYNNEGGANFRTWAKSIGDGCFRRFQIRDAGTAPTPPISNTDVEEQMVTLEVVVAYPQTSRTGKDGALDRDDAASLDAFDIETALGMRGGRQNFSPPNPDACWRSGGIIGRELDGGVDFSVLRFVLSYRRTMT